MRSSPSASWGSSPSPPSPPPPPRCFLPSADFLAPATTSSIRRSIHADSIAVFMLCVLTTKGSQIPISFMSASSPVSPLMPQLLYSPSLEAACKARSSVIRLTTSAPQFCANVRGMTSSASATTEKGHFWIPWIEAASLRSATASAISTAPPPGSSLGSRATLRDTSMQSCKLRSTSLRRSFEGPRRRIVQAFGDLQSTKNEKYSSPIFSTWNTPQSWPTCSSLSSDVRCTMVAPVTRARRLLSVLRRRRSAVTPALTKKCCARSEMPFSVMTMSGLTRRISSTVALIQSSSALRSASQSPSLLISTLVWLSPFLYSS
mmetsp:Transcript_47647/g.69864  ORF Transcript_47647/g.69864 Transcript_47647/m.69864 type:complete len:318 (-) Transcript_47647:49-1002(-)